MAKKKKQSVYELHNQQFWRMYQWALPLNESYPEIKSVKIDITFQDPMVMATPLPGHSISVHSKRRTSI